jgi:glycine/D-amino acid oxidase-like deaminating enzyme
MDRRRFIGSALGAAFAAPGLTGCRPAAPRGELLGPDLRLGHRLRLGDFPSPSTRRTASVVIAGGGIAGLSAAWWLKRQGCEDFVLLECEPQPGGNTRSDSSAVTRYPWGAHYLALPSRAASELLLLLEELGFIRGRTAQGDPVYDERYLVFPPRERLFVDGAWRSGLKASDDARSHAQFARFDELLQAWAARKGADGREAFASPAALSSLDPAVRALDRLSMAQWLADQDIDDRQLLWYVDYACRDDFGGRAADISAWAGLHYFVGRKPGAGYASDAVLTAPEGNGFLADRLAQLCRAQTMSGEIVYRVTPQRGSVEVFAFDGTSSTAWRARQVVLAMPQFALPFVLPGSAPAASEYAPWAVANLHVRALPEGRGAPPAWDNVLYDSPALGYVAATHQQLRQHTGASVLTWYLPLTARPAAGARHQLLAKSWSQWTGFILADLRRAHPEIDELVERIDVWRWGHGMVKPLPGAIAAAAARARSPAPNVHLAHSDLSAMSLFEEAHYWGVQAAKRALARL